MEAVAAIGTLATLYSIIKGIFKLQEKVVKYKEDVDEFVSFIRATETLLLREESLLRDYQQGHGTLPEPVAALLGKFEIYLLQSKDLLEKLTFYSPITEFDAPNQMKRLRQDIQDVKLEMVLAMVFNAGSRQRVQQTAQAFQQAPARESVHSQPHSQTTYQDQDSQGKISRLMVLGFDKESVTQALELCGGDKEQAATYLFELQDTSLTPQYGRPNRTPLFHTSTSATFYPPDHKEIGWEAYRRQTSQPYPPDNKETGWEAYRRQTSQPYPPDHKEIGEAYRRQTSQP